MIRCGRGFQRWVIAVFCLLAASGAGAADSNPAPKILFNRDIRPILTDTCFPCHGFDANKRKANLRLDTAEGMVTVHEGRQAVKPGDLDKSELWRRISAADPKLAMPPRETGKKLKPEQIELLRQWILQGGAYQKHWAFEPPVRPEAPAVKDSKWVRNDIDRFILAELESKNLEGSPERSRETLVRRLTLDLTGLPPSLDETEVFVNDRDPDAYERLVDRLLQSPRYGEHMARYWLDIARYGDTHGLHLDNERSMWPYRDWVVSAFNRNLPFDQFTVWQLAGDLLPNPAREQVIASGFNRCNVSTSEGGAIDEEFQVRYAIDRVETTSTTWMGLTMGCAVCHDHKLDPIMQKEFYQVFSIFNNIAENAMDGNALLPPPTIQLPTPEQEKQIAELDKRKGELETQAKQIVASINYVDPATLEDPSAPEPKEITWIEDDFPAQADVTVNSDNAPVDWITHSEGPVFSGDKACRRSGKGIHQVFFTQCAEPLTVGAGDRLFAYVFIDPKDPPRAIMLQFHTDGWKSRANWGDEEAIPYGARGTTEKVQVGKLPKAGDWVRLEVRASRLGLRPGTKITGLALTQSDGTCYWDKAGQVSVNDPAQNPERSLVAWAGAERALGDKSAAPQEIKALLKKNRDDWTDAERVKVKDYFLMSTYNGGEGDLGKLRVEMYSIRDKRQAIEKEIPATMVSKELQQPRSSWVLIRGQYDKHGEPVGPGVPSVLPPLPKSDVTNRLTFAKWLVDPKHPLTSRVTVNRLWQQFFGTGIVKTSEDFGSKGEWPSHPGLLDWLATEFMSSGWDVKHMVKLIVTSATYRQDSKVTPRVFAFDPENRLLARGPRFRLDAEVLRDNALFLSGLINLKAGGRGVKPYQPPGIWEAVGYTTSNTAKYSQDHGDALYRRSLYSFWKRTAPPPSMTTFDGPSREQCRARRERTNTPLQALLTMNDTQYFEAARQFGYRMVREGGDDDVTRLCYGFRLATARQPTERERDVLLDALTAERSHFEAHPEDAKKAIAVGESMVPNGVPPVQLAAYTMLANLLLNLDEVVTKN